MFACTRRPPGDWSGRRTASAWYGYVTFNNAFGLAEVDGVVYVGLSYDGMAAFDATTFDYLPYLSVRTPGPATDAIYAIAGRPTEDGVSLASASTSEAVPSLSCSAAWSRAGSTARRATSSSSAREPSTRTTRPPRYRRSQIARAPDRLPVQPCRGTSRGPARYTGGAGIKCYELGQSRNGGAWSTLNVSLRSGSRGRGDAQSRCELSVPGALSRSCGNVGVWAYGTDVPRDGRLPGKACRSLPRQVVDLDVLDLVGW